MTSVEDAVLQSFFKRIAAEPSITEAVEAELRSALLDGKKLPSADALAQIFIEGSGDKLA